MTVRKRGRPSRNEVNVAPEAILVEALSILDSSGADALTMRALAGQLGVNPMTIYHHFGDRDGLIKAMAERVYATVTLPVHGEIQQRISELLHSYYSQVVCHPGLTLCIFGNLAVFPDHAKRISDDLTALLRELGLAPTQSRLWLNILVDFTHGAALATAMNRSATVVSGRANIQDKDYADAVSALLTNLKTASV